ncbi:MAG TPA: Lpg1974 family pore-forming outer membrane protein [Pirellulales bacterium]|nr:Lpg1974 family pore-forming outer membrane protein [Pirellulales bacterium]
MKNWRAWLLAMAAWSGGLGMERLAADEPRLNAPMMLTPDRLLSPPDGTMAPPIAPPIPPFGVATPPPSAGQPQPSMPPQPADTAFSQPEPMTAPIDGTVYPQATMFPVTVGVPALPRSLQLHAGILFLRPGADNLGYAVLTNEKNFTSPVPLATPYWNVETLHPAYTPGFEVGAGYTFNGTGRDFQMNWQHLRTMTQQYETVTQSDGQWISPFSQTGPPTADNYAELYSKTGVGKLVSASGQATFAYDSANFDFGQYVNFGRRVSVRFLGGLSYSFLREQIISSFFGGAPPAGATFPDNVPLYLSFNQTSTFAGVGPRLGFDSTYTTARGFRFNGQLAGALLIGQTQPAQYQFAATGPGLASIGIPLNQEWIGSAPYFHVVPAVNAKLGIGYVRTLRNGLTVNIDGGYMAAWYSNPFAGYETNENILGLQIGSLSSGSVRHVLSNFSVDGFYLNGGVRW